MDTTNKPNKKRSGDQHSLPEATKKAKLPPTTLFQLNSSWTTSSDSKIATSSTNNTETIQTLSTAMDSDIKSSIGDHSSIQQSQFAPRKNLFGFAPREKSSTVISSKTSNLPSITPQSSTAPIPSPSILRKPTVDSNLPPRFVAEGMSVDQALEKVVPAGSKPKQSSNKPLIVIDTANVSHEHGGGAFSTQGLPIVVEYYKSKGFSNVVAFLPDHYLTQHYPDPLQDWSKLEALVEEKILIPTPAADYDDVYMVQYARKNDGVIVTNDKYRDIPLSFKDPQERKTVAKWIMGHRIPFKFQGDTFIQRSAPKDRSLNA
jgi:hypothetical protein